jgi:hypothetical protein
MSRTTPHAAPRATARREGSASATSHALVRPIVRWGLAVAAVVAGAFAAPAAQAQPHATRYEQAHVDYEIGHYQKAFAEFARLADEGHCDAARIAQQMARYGRPVYFIDFDVAPERLDRWQGLPNCPAGALARR